MGYDFASDLIKTSDNQTSAAQEIDFASDLVSGNRATSGRQTGSGNFPPVNLPQSAISDPSRGASIGTAFTAGVATDPNAALKYFAKRRGIPEDRYAFLNGDIVYRGDDGKWYKEVSGFLPNIAYRAPDVAEMAPGMVAGALSAPLAISSPMGTLAAGTLVGTTDAATNAIRQNIAKRLTGQQFNEDEVALTGGLSLLGEATPALVAAKKERRLVSDFAQRNLPMEARLRQLSGKYDVPLTVAEITGLPSLMTQQKVLGNVAPSSNKMSQMYKVREDKVRSAVDDYLNQLSSVDDVADAGKMGQDALNARKAALEQDRDNAVKPLYEEAFAQSVPVDTGGVIRQIDGFLKTVPDEGQAARYLKRIKGLLYRDVPDVDPQTLTPLVDAEGKQLTKRAPEDRLPVLHNAKLELDSLFKEEAFGSLDKTMQRRLMAIKEDLMGAMGKENPSYLNANATFSDLSKPLNEFSDRITGTSLTKIPQDNLKNFASRIFENPSAKTVKYAKDQIIAGGGQEAWDAVVRAHLDSAWSKSKKPVANATTGKLDAGNTWQNILFGDKKQDEALRVALEPQQYQALRDLAQVLEAAGRVKKLGSDTAFNQLITEELMKNPPIGSVETGAARITAEILQPWNVGKRISDWAIKRDAAKNADKLADIITQPDAIAKLKELRKMKPTEARYWAGLGQLLGDAGVIELYRPVPDSDVGVSSGN